MSRLNPIRNTWTLTTSSVTADQLIGSYTVPAGRKFRITNVLIEAYLSVLNTTAVYLGTVKLQINGADWLGPYEASNTASGALFGIVIPIPSGVDVEFQMKVQALCTPAAVTSTVWTVTLVGFEIE
jgi:hypothetical protein